MFSNVDSHAIYDIYRQIAVKQKMAADYPSPAVAISCSPATLHQIREYFI